MQRFAHFTSILGILIISGFCGVSAQANDDDLAITNGLIRLPPPGSQTAAAYLDIENHRNTDVCLMSITTDIAALPMIHQTIHDNGKSSMRETTQLTIPAHGSLQLQPGGMHIMLMNLEQPLLVDEDIYFNLHFSDGTTKSTVLKVKDMRENMDATHSNMDRSSHFHDGMVHQH